MLSVVEITGCVGSVSGGMLLLASDGLMLEEDDDVEVEVDVEDDEDGNEFAIKVDEVDKGFEEVGELE